MPSAWYSTSFHPMPTPSRNLPRVSTSTSAACLATSTVWRCGRMSTPVTSSRFVCAARNPNSTKTSWNGVSEVYGPRQSGRVDTSAPITWSYGIKNEKPLSSVARPKPTMRSGSSTDLGLGEGHADLHAGQRAHGGPPKSLTHGDTRKDRRVAPTSSCPSSSCPSSCPSSSPSESPLLWMTSDVLSQVGGLSRSSRGRWRPGTRRCGCGRTHTPGLRSSPRPRRGARGVVARRARRSGSGRCRAVPRRPGLRRGCYWSRHQRAAAATSDARPLISMLTQPCSTAAGSGRCSARPRATRRRMRDEVTYSERD